MNAETAHAAVRLRIWADCAGSLCRSEENPHGNLDASRFHTAHTEKGVGTLSIHDLNLILDYLETPS